MSHEVWLAVRRTGGSFDMTAQRRAVQAAGGSGGRRRAVQRRAGHAAVRARLTRVTSGTGGELASGEVGVDEQRTADAAQGVDETVERLRVPGGELQVVRTDRLEPAGAQ